MAGVRLKSALLAFMSLFIFGDVNSADAQQRYPGERSSCPPGTVAVRETGDCVQRGRSGGFDRREDERFDRRSDRRTERRPDYRDDRNRDRGDYRPEPRREVSTVCRFRSGPRAGTSFDYAAFGMAPIAVGGPCNDGVASQGVVVSNGRYRR